jgi:hypothetical protein
MITDQKRKNTFRIDPKPVFECPFYNIKRMYEIAEQNKAV